MWKISGSIFIYIYFVCFSVITLSGVAVHVSSERARQYFLSTFRRVWLCIFARSTVPCVSIRVCVQMQRQTKCVLLLRAYKKLSWVHLNVCLHYHYWIVVIVATTTNYIDSVSIITSVVVNDFVVIVDQRATQKQWTFNLKYWNDEPI